MKPVFTMMIGLPGSGKTSRAKELEGQNVICSSDEIRRELFGDEGHVCTKQENAKVFEEMFKRTKSNLLAGNNVVYDATNLSKKRRIGLLKQLSNVDCQKECIWMATDYEICLQRNKERERTVPESVLQEMYQRFAPPHESEGWDEIEISAMFDVNTYNMERLSESLDFDQKNHHHSFALREHLQHTKDYVKTKTQDSLLTTAAILHDIGKLKTQTIDENGEAHYYNHQSVGAYDSIFYLIELAEEKLGSVFNTPAFCDNLLEISNLIYYHMHPYLSWKQSEKAKEKDRALLGEEMFNKIMLLHEADVAAH